MRKFLAILFRYFLQGIVVIGPLAVTIYFLYWVFDIIDGSIPWFSHIAPGIGFLTIIVVITIIGYIGTRFFLFRWMIDAFGNLLEHIPGIKIIYTSVKEVIDSFMGDKRKFNNPVWVRTNISPEIWRVGFLTQKNLASLGEVEKVAVYLPHSYAISGWVVVVNKAEVKPLTGMNATEAMKFAVSGGVAGMPDSDPRTDSFK